MKMFDFVVYGATGFTGKRVALCLQSRLGGKYTYAIAGRNNAKLMKVKESMNDESTGVIVADGEDKDTLLAMCKQAKVLLNCVGPYRYYGEDVVTSCIANGTHYVDVTGEPEFMESMEEQYMEAAKEAGCFIITGCGFDSIPADLGALFTQRQFSTPSRCTQVQAKLTITGSSSANFATYESAIQGIANSASLVALRKRVQRTKPTIPGPRPPPPSRYFDQEMNSYLIPFPGSDASVVKRTQAFLSEHGVAAAHFRTHIVLQVSSAFKYYSFLFYSGLILALAKTAYGRTMLLEYPEGFTKGLVSRQGPSDEEINSCEFQMDFTGIGMADSKSNEDEIDMVVKTRVSGPEPGYVATPIILLEAAVTVFEESPAIEEFVGASGGVYTTGSAFYNTELIERLNSAGIKFQVLEEST